MDVFATALSAKFNPPKDIRPSFDGRTVIITGANTGVGFEAALKFVQLGASKVILAVRSVQNGEAAKAKIERQVAPGNGKIVSSSVMAIWQVDMLDYASIKAFAKRVDNELDRLDYAVLNAGIVMATHQNSAYGWEKMLQVNTLSTVLLGLLLLPKLRASKTTDFTPVLELISSGGADWVKEVRGFDDSSKQGILESYNDEKNFDAMMGYCASKLFLECAKTALVKLANGTNDHAPDVYIVSVCPGPTKSDIARDQTAWYMRVALGILRLMQRSTEEGSRSYISGLTLGAEGQGAFWQHDRMRE
jgi:NAD(P)-dependent dehydrogenase (short-subunit alcohol dehydrogenase family)